MNELNCEHRLSVVEDRSKSNQHRLDEVEKRQESLSELVKSVAIIAQKQSDMDGDVQEIKKDVKGLLAAPSKRWEKLITALLAAVATTLVAMLASLAGG